MTKRSVLTARTIRLRPNGGGRLRTASSSQQLCTTEITELFRCWKSRAVDDSECAPMATALQACLSAAQPQEVHETQALGYYLKRVMRD